MEGIEMKFQRFIKNWVKFQHTNILNIIWREGLRVFDAAQNFSFLSRVISWRRVINLSYCVCFYHLISVHNLSSVKVLTKKKSLLLPPLWQRNRRMHNGEIMLMWIDEISTKKEIIMLIAKKKKKSQTMQSQRKRKNYRSF